MGRDELGFVDYDWYAPRVFVGGILVLYTGVIYRGIVDAIENNHFQKTIPEVRMLDSTYNAQKKRLENALHILDSTHTAQRDSLRKAHDLEKKVGGK
jgi:hypothetical protein